MDLVLKREANDVGKSNNAQKANGTIMLPAVHVVAWVLFLSLPALFNTRGEGMGLSMFLDDLAEPQRWSNGLLLIVVFYFNYYVAIPTFYVRRQYPILGVFFLFWFAVFFLLNYSLAPAGMLRVSNGGGFEVLGSSFNLFMFLIVYITSYALCLYELWQRIKEEKLNTEILFLKSQINPHFLFNTLNSIYSLSITQPDKAPDAIIKLSGLMRYTVSETNQDHVSLYKELAYIDNYIELQSLRLSDKINISYEVSGIAEGQQIAPFLLIPFVENAFKYGVNADELSDIRISVNVAKDDLHLTVTNNKVYIRPDIHNTSTGLGINTTRQRLSLMYPGRHELVVKENEDEFAVSLFIKLNDQSLSAGR